MIILQIFNKYQLPGGEEASVLRVAHTLDKNHKVVRCYFDSKEWAERGGLLDRLRQAFSMLWNPSAIRRVRKEIDEHQPDLILLHNIFPICSAGMLFMLVRGRAPVVQYVHNFRPFSVNGYLWGSKGLLDQGLDKNFIPEILDGAWQDSKVRTAWYAMILWALHFTGTFRKIDRWIAISEFMQRKFIEAGIPPRRVEMLRHSWDPSPQLAGEAVSEDPDGNPPYILFLGRLTSAKGVDVLLDAWNLAKPRLQSGKLVIGGEGPMEQAVIDAAKAVPSIEFRGHVSGEEKFQLLHGARAVVAPSVWWEPLGIVVYEAYDHAKPALVASSGGLTETVVHGQTGLLHCPGDAAQFADHIVQVCEDRSYAHQLGLQGKSHLLQITDPALWKSQMEEILQDVVSESSRSQTSGDGWVKAEKRKTEKRKEEFRSQESGVRGQEPGASDLSLLPPSTKHKAQSTAPQALPLPQSTIHDLQSTISNPQSTIHDPRSSISISIYLADQNPKLGRSLGITRMTEVVMEEMQARGTMDLLAVASKSSVRESAGMGVRVLPWSTRHTATRLLTDHFHPLLLLADRPDVWYYPKGFLPMLHSVCTPSVVTIHDTIVQYYADHYPNWRSDTEYRYWAHMLRHTLTNADHVLTVSESSKRQILDFMERHEIPEKEITVTYEPCLYESIPQPEAPEKGDYVLHLASREPHKRTSWLIDHWLKSDRKDLPRLHVVGALPDGVAKKIEASDQIEKLPFLDDAELQVQFMGARALVFPSEIEGFGLPAIEAYYLGTPVCFVKGNSVEEVLAVATQAGGFHLNDPASLDHALADVLAMPPTEIHRIGLHLRKTYAATKVVDRMVDVFEEAAAG